MIQYKTHNKAILLFSLIVIITFSGIIFAQSSTNFSIKRSVVNQGGASSQSTNFKIVDVVGQASTAGAATSVNFSIKSGFFAGGSAAFAPDPPSNLVVSQLPAWPDANTMLKLTWQDNSNNEDGFLIESRPDTSNDWSQLTSVGPGVTTYTDCELDRGTGYCYRVRAFNQAGNSNYSNVDCNSTKFIPDPPDSVVTIYYTDSTVVTWRDNSDNEDYFRINKNGVPYDSVGSDIETYIDYNPQPLNTIKTAQGEYANVNLPIYVIRAVNESGPSPGAGSDAPPAPDPCNATAVQPNSIRITWNDNSTNETHFIITRTEEDNGIYEKIVVDNYTPPGGGTTFTGPVSYTDNEGIVHGPTYYYLISAVNEDGIRACPDAHTTLETISIPSGPTGPISGKVGQSLSFTTGGSTTDLGHPIQYQFDLGDGTQSPWGSETQNLVYSDAGTNNVKSRARCQTHNTVVSDWSSPVSVSISYCSLVLTVNPTGTGTISKIPDKTDFLFNEEIDLIAIANAGYQFDHWEGDLSGNNHQETLTIDGDKNVTAHFVEFLAELVHFSFIATDESYSIVIDAATLDGVNLAAGDEIGVFTPARLCVGASVWTDTTPLGLAAWRDDPSTPDVVDGFQPGEIMFFRIWDSSSGSTDDYVAIPTFSTGDGTFGSASFARISFLEAQTSTNRTILLNTGWNWISSNVEPTDPNVASILGLTSGLEIMQNCAGGFYIPGVINGIGNWNVAEMYVVYVGSNDAVTIEGQMVPYNSSIPLNEGWNCIAYFPEVHVPADVALNSIVDELEIAQQDNGNFYIPGLLNTIGDMQVGEGYKLYLKNNAILTYPSGEILAKKSSNIHEGSLVDAQTHFTFTATAASYSIVIDGAKIDGQDLEVDDEIGVFTPEGLCVGASVWTGMVPLGLAAWADDSQTSDVDGYTAGDIMHFRIWDASENMEYMANAEYTAGGPTFESAVFSRISLSAPITSISTASSQIPSDFYLGFNYPNPFNPETTIEYHLSQAAEVKLTIYDVQGHEVRRLVVGRKAAGFYSIAWDARDDFGHSVASGIYFYRLEVVAKGSSYNKARKTILTR